MHLYRRRRNVAAEVAEELKTTTNAMGEHEKSLEERNHALKKKQVFYASEHCFT